MVDKKGVGLFCRKLPVKCSFFSIISVELLVNNCLVGGIAFKWLGNKCISVVAVDCLVMLVY